MSIRNKFLQAARIASSLLFALAVLCLPITSLPVLSRLMGGSMVAPPSIVLAGLALILWLPVFFAERQSLPREFIPLAAFCVAALVSSLLSFYRVLPPFKANSSLSEIISALLTLIIGVTCYIGFSLWCVRKQNVQWLFKLLNLGGAVMLLWSFAQLYILFLQDRAYPGWMLQLQNLLSVNSLEAFANQRRANGFAFEPSWLAHQLNVLYIPWWMASTITGYSAFKVRLWRISAENLLLAAGVAVLLGSMSRIGLLTFLLLVGFLFLSLTSFFARRLSRSSSHPRLATIAIGLGILIVFAAFSFGLIYAMSRVDLRIARVFDMEKIPSDWLALAMSFSLAERAAYWSVGLYLLGKFPLFGAGLGNAGFFFSQAIPEKTRVLFEVIKIETQFNTLPNIKSLWLRLLGETGLVGFGLFAAWLVQLWAGARQLQRSADIHLRALGWMGLLVLLALVGEGFSIDSFALPYYWVGLGILTGASWLARQTAQENLKA